MIAQLFRPWHSGRLWWVLVHLSLGLVTSSVLFGVVVAGLTTTASVVVIVPLAVGLAWLTLVVTRWCTLVERSRFAAVLGVELIDTTPARPVGATRWQRLRLTLQSGERWREVAWALLHFPVAIFSGTLALALWAAGAVATAVPLWVWALPHRQLDGIDAGGPAAAVGVFGVAVMLLIAPWVTVGLGAAEESMARWLLGSSRAEELEAAVGQLETSRAAAVDSAESERRRIERDLHDGAQQRLIAVAMDLGLARDRLDTDPDRAKELVTAAHEDVKAALKELRDLVRGIHPVILEDRGLDAALSAVVARASVPVSLRVDVAERPSPAVESAAYFIVSEALVNVDRHARAQRATVEIARVADRLTIAITDDGVGGAEVHLPAPGTGTDVGTGLAGLSERVAGLGGWFRVISPVGGPTSILVELPCES